MSRPPNFDLIARPYRWLEYIALGRSLERCRLHFLPQLARCSRALVLGDGDGRFLARLLDANPRLTADAVDLSAAMLTLLRTRCAFASSRLATHQSDALAFTRNPRLDWPQYDLVVTHFFLDCLTQSQVETLAAAVVPQLAPHALWLVSDFRIPTGPMRLPAKVLVCCLYFAFRILTALRQTHLPDHASALTGTGLTRIALKRSLFGILSSELWTNSPPSSPASVRMTI